jgi:hypothetical protein
MIGDDEIEAEGFGSFSGGEGADTGVNADDEADALRGCGFENLIAHAVAFAEAVRDVETDRAAEHLNGCFEQNGGGGAIDVIVAIDEDRFAALDGLLHAGDSGGHAVHAVGIEKMIQLRLQEVSDFLRGAEAAGEQKLGNDEWQVRCVR